MSFVGGLGINEEREPRKQWMVERRREKESLQQRTFITTLYDFKDLSECRVASHLRKRVAMWPIPLDVENMSGEKLLCSISLTR